MRFWLRLILASRRASCISGFEPATLVSSSFETSSGISAAESLRVITLSYGIGISLAFYPPGSPAFSRQGGGTVEAQTGHAALLFRASASSSRLADEVVHRSATWLVIASGAGISPGHLLASEQLRVVLLQLIEIGPTLLVEQTFLCGHREGQLEIRHAGGMRRLVELGAAVRRGDVFGQLLQLLLRLTSGLGLLRQVPDLLLEAFAVLPLILESALEALDVAIDQASRLIIL